MRIRGALAGLAAALVAVVGVSPAAQAASYTVTFSGVVTCSSSSQAVVGVYVNNWDGSDGFASWTPFPGRANSAIYKFTTTASRTDPSIRLDVGCGGTKASWAKNLRTVNFRTKNGAYENRACNTAAATKTVACTPAPKGLVTTANLGYSGYCTWGAYKKWQAFTGYWPNIGGNAIKMDDNAKANGFRVTDVPHVNSMVVLNTGTFGHVGWVTKVYIASGKVYIDYVDMNGGTVWVNQAAGITDKFDKWTTKTAQPWNTSVQRFIVAPD